MKKVYTSLILLFIMLFGAMSIAQEQQKSYINYQGVARKADGTLMAGEPMTVGIGLKFGSASSETIYEESHELTADANGVFSLLIGNGNALSGDYNDLPWGDFATFATVSMNGSPIGTTELMAVPYALSSADNQWHSMGDDIENKNGGNVFVTGSLYASKDLSLANGAAVNEFSTDISLSANSDELVPTQKAIKTYVDNQVGSGGGGGADDQTAAEVPYDNSTSGLTATTAQAAIDELVTGGSVDADADPNNEIQDISLSGTELSISDGSTIDLAPIVPPGGTDDQNLVLTGDVLSIEDGSGSVDLNTYKDDADADPTNEIDVTAETGILIGDGSTVTGLVGTADGQVAKWDDATSSWIAGTDDTGGGGSGTPSGLEALDEGNGIGWRLIGRDPNDYGNIGDNAVDLSYFDEAIGGGGATGNYSLATGWNTSASGDWSTATGRQTNAQGDGSFATGWQNMALGDYSVVMGRETIAAGSRSVAMGMETSADNIAAFSMGMGTYAAGRYSAAMGINTRSDAQGSFAVGKFNAGGGDPDNWVATDPLFEIGIGANVGSRTNAMTVLKNGNVGIGEDVPTAKLEVDGNIQSSDLAGVGERNVVADASGNLIIGAGGGGSSLWTENGSNIYFDSGNVGIGTNNPAVPLEIKRAEGRLLLIESTSANSYMQYATPSGKIGYSGVWSNDNDVDFGTTSANNSGKVHLTTKATPKLTVAANGNVGIGTTGPATKLHIKSNSTVSSPHIKIEEEGNDYARIEFTNNTSNALWHIAGLADNTPANSKINFYFRNNNGAANRMTITGDGNVLVDGSLVHSSDHRLKKDMEELPYGLKEILQLEPKIYRWVDNRNAGSRSLGLIAQAVQPIIPEIVHEEDDSEKTLSLSYTELIPVIVSAIKEQHKIIGDQSKRISDLEERLKKLEAKIDN